MHAVIGLFSRRSDAQTAHQKIQEHLKEGQKNLLLDAQLAYRLNQVITNRPEQGAMWGALIGLLSGALIGLVIGLAFAYTPGENYPLVFPLLGAVFTAVISAYLGALYSTRLRTAQLQAFKETLADGGALVLVTLGDQPARRLEAAIRSYGGTLVNTFKVQPEQLRALRGEQQNSPAGA